MCVWLCGWGSFVNICEKIERVTTAPHSNSIGVNFAWVYIYTFDNTQE